MSNRPHGHYHVMHGAFESWAVAEHCEEGWLLPGINTALREEQFEQIGTRIPTPDEPWQTVPVEPTHAMHLAGESAYEGGMSEYPDPSSMYREMLADAPRPGGGDD